MRKHTPPDHEPARNPEQETLNPITATQQQLIEALLTGQSITRAAALASISKTTALHWLHDTNHPVHVEYHKQRHMHMEQFHQRIASLHNLALTALESLLSADAPPAIRFQAAKMIYEAHLQEHSAVRFPGHGQGMAAEEASRFWEQQNTYQTTEIYLYDANGRKRNLDGV